MGVARSRKATGPYEKIPYPLRSPKLLVNKSIREGFQCGVKMIGLIDRSNSRQQVHEGKEKFNKNVIYLPAIISMSIIVIFGIYFKRYHGFSDKGINHRKQSQ